MTTSQAGDRRDASLSRIAGHDGCPPTQNRVWGAPHPGGDSALPSDIGRT
ncbi:hypothetical protein I546_1261 [Mycobacterium kansasii 732]|nr:hypothetical protein I546_1261 [Mycobacterium kansasii 732]